MVLNKYIQRRAVNLLNTKVIACATVIEEMLPLIGSNNRYEILDFGLHINPDKLRKSLQDSIDKSESDIDTIVLGYGLCAQAVVGLKSGKRTLVVPRVDDCIGIFLGSDAEYQKQFKNTPGTYYFTKGWIEVSSTPFHQYNDLVKKYGDTKAEMLMARILKNYTRLALINTGQEKMGEYRNFTQYQANKFGLEFEEIPGSDLLIRKMLFGPYDNDFVVTLPGNSISFADFKVN
jgi:hypothetical protein